MAAVTSSTSQRLHFCVLPSGVCPAVSEPHGGAWHTSFTLISCRAFCAVTKSPRLLHSCAYIICTWDWPRHSYCTLARATCHWNVIYTLHTFNYGSWCVNTQGTKIISEGTPGGCVKLPSIYMVFHSDLHCTYLRAHGRPQAPLGLFQVFKSCWRQLCSSETQSLTMQVFLGSLLLVTRALLLVARSY